MPLAEALKSSFSSTHDLVSCLCSAVNTGAKQEVEQLSVCASFIRFTRYYYGKQIKEDGMDRTGSTHGRHDKCIRNFDRNTTREETTQRLRRRSEDNIRMDVKEVGWKM